MKEFKKAQAGYLYDANNLICIHLPISANL